MNKKIIVLAILAGSAFASVANAASGTINFTGNVTADACTVSSASQNQTVDLGTVSVKDFPAAGATTGDGKISIVLSNCPASARTAAVSFGGPAHAENPNILALASASTAKHVGIALFESDNVTEIPLATKSLAHTLSTTADTTLTYYAKYKSTAAAVTEGSANAAADFTVLYN